MVFPCGCDLVVNNSGGGVNTLFVVVSTITPADGAKVEGVGAAVGVVVVSVTVGAEVDGASVKNEGEDVGSCVGGFVGAKHVTEFKV